MLYSDFVTAIGAEFVYAVTSSSSATPFADTNINNILPRAIEYVELRLLRDPDLDFLAATTTATATCTANMRTLTKPSALVVTELAYAITPAGSSPDAVGSARNVLERVSLDFLNAVWGQAANGGATVALPTMIAVRDDGTFIIAPTPDQNYVVEFTGTSRPTPLSSGNTSNFLTLNLPDLYLMVANIFFAGYQKNFGAQADDPKSAQSYENQYNILKKGAQVEEARKKFLSSGRSFYAAYPPNTATPPPSG